MKLLLQCIREQPDTAAIREAVRSGVNWDETLALADDHGLAPLVNWRLELACPDLVPASVLDSTRAVFNANVARNLRLTRDLGNIMAWLGSVHIPAVPFKGPTLTALAYEHLGMRYSSDLDILVPPERVGEALRVLGVHGYRPRGAGGADGLAGNNEIDLCAEGCADIDLHWNISPNYFFPFDCEPVWNRLGRVSVAGVSLPTLGAEDLFLCLALHGARHCWSSLGLICDVGFLLKSRPPEWERVLAEAGRARTTRVAMLAVLLAVEVAGSEVPGEILRRARADVTARRLAVQVRRNLLERRPEDDFAGTPGGGLMQIRMAETAGDRLRYVWRRATMPNQTDNDFLSLPAAIRPALYLLRPLRILGKALGWRRR